MATSRVSFTTETLAILNMLESGETINYDWVVDEDYSIVLAEGSIDVNQTLLTGVAEHRIQPNTYLTATCISSERAYFITLFDATRDGLIDQIISSTSKTKLRSYAPYWYDEGMPSSDSITSNWESSFSSGHLVYGKGDIDAQIAAYGETSESFKND